MDFVALHWSFPPEVIQAHLPAELAVHTYDGKAWVGLTPLLMSDVAPIGLPALPWLGEFPEINLRTYVIGPDGQDGLWFFSLEAARLPFVLAARSLYGVPYVWASMQFSRPSDRVLHFESKRCWPGSTGAHLVATVGVGPLMGEDEVSEFDAWLLGRWRAYSQHPVAGLLVTDVVHEPWPLHRAALRHLDEGLVAAAGLPTPSDPPYVLASPRVHVRLGLPRPVRPAPAP